MPGGLSFSRPYLSDELKCFLLLAASGCLQAAFALPVNHFRRWRWEHMWVAQSVTSNLLFPFLWAALLPGAFWARAAALPLSHWLNSWAWGLLWGLGGVAYGLTLTSLGISFSYSFVFGTTTLAGALLPLALGKVERPRLPELFALALVSCLAAIVAIGWLQRGRAKKPSMPMPISSPSYRWALILAVFAGVFSASYGLAFAFGFTAIQALIAGGAATISAPLAVALPVSLGASSVAIPLGLFCARRSGTLPLFFRGHALRNWFLALVMGVCGVGGVLLYGLAGSGAGHPSPNVAFGIYMTFFVLGGNAIGLLAGEMRGCGAGERLGLALSICGLIAGAWLLNLR